MLELQAARSGVGRELKLGFATVAVSTAEGMFRGSTSWLNCQGPEDHKSTPPNKFVV